MNYKRFKSGLIPDSKLLVEEILSEICIEVEQGNGSEKSFHHLAKKLIGELDRLFCDEDKMEVFRLAIYILVHLFGDKCFMENS